MEELTTRADVSNQINNIVYFELKELRDTMDSLECHNVWFDDEEGDAPTLNLKVEDGHYVQWVVVKVQWGDDDVVRINCHLWETPYTAEPGDDYGNRWFDYEDDAFRDALIPGEITELTKRVEKEVEGISNAYSFNGEQKYAILKFNEAVQRLDKAGVSILLENEDSQAYFVNGNAITDIAATKESGRKELDIDNMTLAPHIFDFQFFASNGVYAKPKSND